MEAVSHFRAINTPISLFHDYTNRSAILLPIDVNPFVDFSALFLKYVNLVTLLFLHYKVSHCRINFKVRESLENLFKISYSCASSLAGNFCLVAKLIIDVKECCLQ
jgi:hypothetical protein